MTANFRVEGFSEIDRALSELAAGTAKGVARRAMKKELKPVLVMANAMWPGEATDVFKITSRLNDNQRRDSDMMRGRTAVNMFIGAPGGRFGTPEAHLVEFGTGPRYTSRGDSRGSVAPHPMLQPAWDANKRRLLPGLGERLWDEITKTQKRLAKKAAKRSAGG